ncbi:ABC transporter permease [Aequorivita antarctica]|uniref:Transport permease protein n=1 Tax=Aequorivita antarctica TaxID=153266 RepID=A0A5C6YXV0_9FLAO|nr:ABC transporter permease [Aequorivita antarctica]TXD72514.1 ABC transporter permease [Aequorivita antarctica]SRX75392.1 Teichoic acid translocation permease protein TagG [Aequorivita antarctica]
MELETKVYQKENNFRIGKMLKESLADIASSRFLSFQLAKRDIQAQYRQSYLGIIWAFVTPLTTAFVWIFLNSSGTIRVTDTGIPYPVYAFSGTLLWSIIKDAITSPMSSTNSAKGIMSKINFPKEAIIISGVYKLLFNSSIKVLLLLVFIFFYGIGFHWSLLLFPLAILGGVLFGTTLGLLITPLGMLYKDIGQLIGFGLGFLMYVTPVVYAIPKTGIIKTVMELNPFTPIILTARDLAVGMPPMYLTYFLIVIACSVPLFFIALLFYRISIPILVERMSA